MSEAVERPIEHEYRNVVSDNRRWSRFQHRPGDIVVCTPPKCGTTWMQAIVWSLLFPDGDGPVPLWWQSPWLDARFEPIEKVAAILEAQPHRRAVKTHTNADGIPWWPSASYIVVGRDGRDAFMSFVNHMRNLDPETFIHLATSAADEGIDLSAGGGLPPLEDIHEFFEWCMNENPIWFDHVASFWAHVDEPNVLFVHFNDMKADLDGQMRRVAAFLGIELDESQWPAVVDRCTFEAMKARSDEISDFAGFVGGAETFLYKGTNGRWRDVLTPDELALFETRCQELLPPEAVAWTTEGQSALRS